jgi:hypothetical protein
MLRCLPEFRSGWWDKTSVRFKKFLLIILSVTLVYISVVLGPAFTHFMYAAVVGLFSFVSVFFPEELERQLDRHETKMIGAAIGFLIGHDLLGAIIGVWAGYYVDKKVAQVNNKIEETKQMAAPVLHPIDTAKNLAQRTLAAARNLIGSDTTSPTPAIEPVSRPQPTNLTPQFNRSRRRTPSPRATPQAGYLSRLEGLRIG